MIFLRSKATCGYRRDGGVLVRKGDNRFDEATLNSNEKAFLKALVSTKVAQDLTEAEYVAANPPSSGTGLTAAAVPSSAEEIVVEEPRRVGKRGRR